MASLIPAAIGGVASIFGSFMSGQPKTTTSSSTTTPTFNQTGNVANAGLSSLSDQLLTDPAAGTEATNLQGIDSINSQYAQMPGQVSQQLAARGFGQSGKLGTAMYNVAGAKAATQAGWNSSMAQLVSNRQMQGAGLAEDLLNANRGTSTNSTTTGPDTSLAAGAMSAGNGLSNLSTLMMLHGIMNPGSGAYGPNGDMANESAAQATSDAGNWDDD